MSEIEQPVSVSDALEHADAANLDDVLIIGTQSDGKLFMRTYGITRLETISQMEVAKMFQLGLLANATDGAKGEQG